MSKIKILKAKSFKMYSISESMHTQRDLLLTHICHFTDISMEE